MSAEPGTAPAHAPLTWSIASCAITIAPFISFCCDADSGGHSPLLCTRAIFSHTRSASSYSFSGPGGNGALHSGQACDTPFARSSDTHPVQNECPHGSRIGSRGGSRQMRHRSVSTASRHSRCCRAWTVAAST